MKNSQGVEPVATLWQHGETGRTRITQPDTITDCDASWFKVSELYTAPPAQTPDAMEPMEPVACVIRFSPEEREPRLISWNRLPDGTHHLYTAPPTQIPMQMSVPDERGYATFTAPPPRLTEDPSPKKGSWKDDWLDFSRPKYNLGVNDE